MTKHVFTNDQCIHVWAQARHGADDWGRGQGNVRFEGAWLWSYGAEIGRIVTDKDGNKVGLINDHRYSWREIEGIARQLGSPGRDVEHECRALLMLALVDYADAAPRSVPLPYHPAR